MRTLESAAPDWSSITPLVVTGAASVSVSGAVLLPTSAGTITISVHACGVRLRLGSAICDYGLLAAQPATLPCSVATTQSATQLRAGEVQLNIEHQPLSFALWLGARAIQSSPSDAHFVRRFRLPPFAKFANGWLVSLELGSDTPVYGLGEKWGRLDKRGQLLESFNHDALGVNADRSYKNVPFAWSPDGWGVFVHTACPVTHAVGFAPWSQRAYVLAIDDPGLDLWIFSGKDGAAQLRQYAELTGHSPLPPLWSLGVILSKAYYKDAEEILAVAREVRARKMPCDVITFDGRAWQDTDTRFAFQWCSKRYPDPRPVIAALKALDFKICVWEYPLISTRNPLFNELAAKGWLILDQRSGEACRYQWDLEPFGAVLTPLPESGLLDFTHSDAYAYWRDRHKELFDIGVDMIKADFGEQIESHMIASNGAAGDALHNIYALLYNRCVYEAAERYGKSGAFLFSRAGWTSSQRYPSQWGGDPQADWGGLAASLRGGLSWGLSGGPFYATDVGGFYADKRDPALYVRWAQAAVFSAHMRLHGVGAREPWSYGSEAETAVMAALQLRYRLIPYLRRAMQQSHRDGLPVQRAMALACPDDRAAWAFDGQFFFGEDLLVAPCLRADGKVSVYLPNGRWVRFSDGESLEGERLEGQRVHHLTLRLQETAVFAREGVKIPLGPAVLHTGQLAQHSVTTT